MTETARVKYQASKKNILNIFIPILNKINVSLLLDYNNMRNKEFDDFSFKAISSEHS